MEQEIIYLGMEEIISRKNNRNYYIARYILNNAPVDDFISKETFDKLSTRKLENLKKYTGIFRLNNKYRTFSIFDIK